MPSSEDSHEPQTLLASTTKPTQTLKDNNHRAWQDYHTWHLVSLLGIYISTAQNIHHITRQQGKAIHPQCMISAIQVHPLCIIQWRRMRHNTRNLTCVGDAAGKHCKTYNWKNNGENHPSRNNMLNYFWSDHMCENYERLQKQPYITPIYWSMTFHDYLCNSWCFGTTP